MNDAQRKLVIIALVVIAIALAVSLLEWDDQYGHQMTKIVVFYTGPTPGYPSVTSDWGLYTRFGIAGALFGIAVPLCLIAGAVYLYLGKQQIR